MNIVHSYSVGNGDMFSIRHDSDNCTIIDCSISDYNKDWLLREIDKQRKGKTITRFISTHPDEDHLMGLATLDEHIKIINFYTVENKATKENETTDFKCYKRLRDGNNVFHLEKDCERFWMNKSNDVRGQSGINILWPITSNNYFQEALKKAAEGESPNNISPIITYSLPDGVTMAWLGDLETNFMENIKGEISWPRVDILFAPHHGRESGKIPKSILRDMDPKIIIIGEAPSKNLNYYGNYNTITQNNAGTICFNCVTKWVHIYVDNPNYSVNFLEYLREYTNDYYIGSLRV